jgi:poly-gamma-glutamate synthesis protein (capsule biosynthesis protein)
MCVTRRLAAVAVVLAALAVPAAAQAGTPEFHGTIKTIGPKIKARMVSWHEGCPVPIARLRLLELDHWGFDAKVHHGRLIVHQDSARKVLRVFHKLFDNKFKIRQMWLVDAYGADDDRSMNADNTSAFNCRFVEGTSRWSEHAYGRAIDINPVENPYVAGSHVSPEKGRRYANRSLRLKGMIHAGDKTVRAFRAEGWGWGGAWSGAKDYQHFSASGR